MRKRALYREAIGLGFGLRIFRWRARAPFRSALFRDSRHADRFAVVHRSTIPGELPWRVSYFDRHGAIGHCARATVEQAIKDSDIIKTWKLERIIT